MCIHLEGRIASGALGPRDSTRKRIGRSKSSALWIGIVSSTAILAPAPAFSQPPTLAGKTVQLLIGFGPGGSYSNWGRLLARHLGDHLPGHPTVVAQNMPGAGSYVATNYIYDIAPKDGTALAIIARDAALGPLTGATGARFDPTRLSWVGTPSIETNVCIASASAEVKKLDDLYSHSLVVGNTGIGTGTYSYPKALDALLGLKFKIIGGFPGAANIFLAMERGEVDGVCLAVDTVKNLRPTWIPKKEVSLLLQGGVEPDPEFKDVPFVVDLAKTREQRQAIEFLYGGQGLGRPFIAPPDMPPDRLKMLRDAFNETMKDPAFLAEAAKQKLEISPRTGEQMAALIQKLAATPKAIIAHVGELIK
jgi:tripartite-type tricarboxylate transporter receptor subunit TctC